jgi:hypothetical protein
MDAKTLQARLDVARSFSHSIGHLAFRCRLVPDVRAIAAMERHRDSATEAARALLGETVLGVSGATTADLGLEDAEPIDDSRETLAILLDARADLVIVLADEITRRIQERRKTIEADAKN